MGVFLILCVFIGGLPAFDFKVFQDMTECMAFKAQIEEVLAENKIKPLYLECKSAPQRQQEVQS